MCQIYLHTVIPYKRAMGGGYHRKGREEVGTPPSLGGSEPPTTCTHTTTVAHTTTHHTMSLRK